MSDPAVRSSSPSHTHTHTCPWACPMFVISTSNLVHLGLTHGFGLVADLKLISQNCTELNIFLLKKNNNFTKWFGLYNSQKTKTMCLTQLCTKFEVDITKIELLKGYKAPFPNSEENPHPAVKISNDSWLFAMGKLKARRVL